LDQIGVRFRPLSVDVEEVMSPQETPEEFVCRAALDKARAGWAGLGPRGRAPVLGADTAVVVDDQVLGKPADVAHARRMLMDLSGRRHRVLTGVALVRGEQELSRLSASSVWFRTLSEREVEAYCATGEPLDKAGAYGIQGMAAAFISRLDGSYSGVMGLPLFETAELLAELGIGMFD
jgi:septum formation protein